MSKAMGLSEARARTMVREASPEPSRSLSGRVHLTPKSDSVEPNSANEPAVACPTRSGKNALTTRGRLRPRPGQHNRTVGLVTAVMFLSLGCSRSAVEQPEITSPSVSATPDRLLPTEPLIGAAHVWGMRVPDGLVVGAEYAKSVYLSGARPLSVVLEGLQDQLVTSHVELTPTRAVIDRAYVKGDATKRLVRVELQTTGLVTRVHIADITPPPVATGLSEAQQWERAGRNPDGTLKDPRQAL